MLFPRWILAIDACQTSAVEARALAARLDAADVVQVHTNDPDVAAAFREAFADPLDQRQLWVVADLSAAAKAPSIFDAPLFAATIRYDERRLRPLLGEVVAALHDRGTLVFVNPLCEALATHHLSGAYDVAPGAGCTPALVIDHHQRLVHPGRPETWLDFAEGLLSAALEIRWARGRADSETHKLPGPVSLPEYPEPLRTFWGGTTMALGVMSEARASKVAFGMSTSDFDLWAQTEGLSFEDTDFPTFVPVDGAVAEKRDAKSPSLPRRKWEFILAAWILLGQRKRLRQAFGIEQTDRQLDLAEVTNRPQEMFGEAVILVVRSKAARERKRAAIRALTLLGAGRERTNKWRNVIGSVDAELGAELERQLRHGRASRRARRVEERAREFMAQAIDAATQWPGAT